MKKWNESSLLALIAALRKVEDNWGVQNWVDPGEKWKHVAAELPELQTHLQLDPHEFPDICKTEFAKICRYYNEVFTKEIEDQCLTYEIMTELASYSLTLRHDEYFPLLRSRTHMQYVRPIILVDIDEGSNEIFDIGCSPTVSIEFEEDRLNQDSSTREVPAFEEDRPNQDSSTREVPSFEEGLNEDSETREDLMPTIPPSNLEAPNRVGFLIKLEDFHFTSKGGLVRIPTKYCSRFMTKTGPVFVTCIRDEQEYQIKYLPHKCSLSAGWKKFARSNALQANDKSGLSPS